ncbi:hypothetical protein GH714_002818 [Hevea brasiliensis]|uniref:AB hydrolase-1 domain-containing protein n=1 Tax=Hevea brasiliensis TaxID=3981 RepID=A0A6A6KI43_HEVBR|nr:hypothetical protein GH714_002818 [Hevea brasiliensis]
MEQLVNFIIRPPRAEYNPKHDLLDQEFMLKRKWYQRKDLEIKNSQGDTLQCSHYLPIVSPGGKPLPCVIYCHGNSGCRADASEAAIILLPSNITVFTLDFSGSGISGGEHVTLGWNEKDDLRAVVDYLRQDGNVSLIGLWGRSMGAVTSLMYGAEDPSIAGIVLDSPFSDLVDLMMELVDTYKFRFPKFTVKFAIQYMRKAVQKRAKFDIMDLNTIKVAKACFVPALFGHAIDDDFIQPHHSDRIFEAYVVNLDTVLKGSIDIPSECDQSEVEGGEIDDDHLPSSSKMISFELSNGHAYGPHVPTTMDDDQYVEYQLDDLAGFPCDVEEEKGKCQPHFRESSQKHYVDASSIAEHCDSLKTVEQHEPSKIGPASSSEINDENSAIEHPSPDPTVSSTGPAFDTSPSMTESRSTTTSGRSDTSGSIQSSIDTDLSSNTKATLTVERNPASHIMDGLLRRWDFSFSQTINEKLELLFFWDLTTR